MNYYSGLDVSLKEVSICVVDDDGQVVARGSVVTNPAVIRALFVERGLSPDRIVRESGQRSIWLHRQLEKLDLPIIRIDARLAHKVLSAKLNKSDKADAEGLAQLARTGWFSEVHIRNEASDQLHILMNARERLLRMRKDLEGHIRGTLKTYGIRLKGISQVRLRAEFRGLLAKAGTGDPLLELIADTYIPLHETLCIAAEDLEEDLRAIARKTRSPVV